jgi:hypothetical protein
MEHYPMNAERTATKAAFAEVLAREAQLRDQREHAQEMLQDEAAETAAGAAQANARQQRNSDDDFYIDMNGKVRRRGAS